MWQDPVVEETRKLRKEYIAQFKGDSNAMYKDILERQAAHKERLVSFEPRRPKQRKKTA